MADEASATATAPPPTKPSSTEATSQQEAEQQHPFLAARPPATDPLTYLTLIEYNLTTESLPVLLEVLQDEELCRAIGWDLINLLVPLLPASEACLRHIAKTGSAREVVLKVTERLRVVEFDEDEDEHGDEDEAGEEAKDGDVKGKTAQATADIGLPLPVVQYQTLLSLLEILHARIKTKYPSRFLSSTLQAVLATYNEAYEHLEELTLANVKLITTLSGSKRPRLPPRLSSSQLLTLSAVKLDGQADDPSSGKANDKEGASDITGPSREEESGDREIFVRLLQSFLTHVLQHYLDSLSHKDDVPGLAWASRLQEKLEPARQVPGKETFAERFASDDDLHARVATVGQLVALAQDLGLTSEDLLATIEEQETDEPRRAAFSDEEDPPGEAKDVPLSKTGALYLLTARIVRDVLYDSAGSTPVLSIFPDQASILRSFIELGSPSIGSEPEPLLDALLTLGLLAIDANEIGEPADDEDFTSFLQATSLISANSPSPSLRYNAHVLTSTILRSHPSDTVRLAFIRDTLEHCPYENLKASAVGWLKGETIEANPPTSTGADSAHSVFATPVALASAAPYLFPDLRHDLVEQPLLEAWQTLKLNFGFWLATLNFWFLLQAAKHLHVTLDIEGLKESAEVQDRFVGPLREMVGRLKGALEEGGELAAEEGEEGVQRARGEVGILEEILGRLGR